MAEQVVLARQDEEDSRETQEVSIITQDDAVVEQDMEDDDDVQYQRENWEVTHVNETRVETTEGEGVDLLAELLELAGWPQVNDEETEMDLS